MPHFLQNGAMFRDLREQAGSRPQLPIQGVYAKPTMPISPMSQSSLRVAIILQGQNDKSQYPNKNS